MFCILAIVNTNDNQFYKYESFIKMNVNLLMNSYFGKIK